MKSKEKSFNIKQNGNECIQNQKYQIKDQRPKTSRTPIKKQKISIEKPQKKVHEKKLTQDIQQNKTIQNSTINNTNKIAYNVFLSNIKKIKKQKNNHNVNSTKNKNKFSSVNSQYKYELQKSKNMIEIMLEKIAKLKAEQKNKNKTINKTFNNSINNTSNYQKTSPKKKKTNIKMSQIHINSRSICKPKKSNNNYNIYKENAKSLTINKKNVKKRRNLSEVKSRNKHDAIFSYYDENDENILKKAISVTYETYDYNKLLEFDSVKKDKKLKSELSKLISENKKLKELVLSPDDLFENAKQKDKIKTNKKNEKVQIKTGKTIEKIETKKIYEKLFKDPRKKNILRDIIMKQEKYIKNILRIKLLEFYYKTKFETFIIKDKIDRSLRPKTNINGNRFNLYNNPLDKSNKEKRNKNNNQNINIPNTNGENSSKNNITSNNPKLAIKPNQNHNNSITNQTPDFPKIETNNNQNINKNKNENNKNKETNNIQNNSINDQQDILIVNDNTIQGNQIVAQDIPPDTKESNEEKHNRTEKARTLRRLLAAREKKRKDTLKKYFHEFLLKGVFSLVLKEIQEKSIQERGSLKKNEKELKKHKSKTKSMIMDYIKKTIYVIIGEQKKEEERNSHKRQLLLRIFYKKDQKIIRILRNNFGKYYLKAKIESLSEYDVKPKHKKKKTKKRKKDKNLKKDESINNQDDENISL